MEKIKLFFFRDYLKYNEQSLKFWFEANVMYAFFVLEEKILKFLFILWTGCIITLNLEI